MEFTDRDYPERTEVSLAGEPRQGPNRAARRELRIPLRYRIAGGEEWHQGETVNISESGLLFSSNELLEVDSNVEITFQTKGTPMLQSSTRQALVVRRTLANWPDTKLMFGARFRS
jgi:PilZ domain